MIARDIKTGKFYKVKPEVKRIRLRKEIIVNIDEGMKKILRVEN